MRIFTAHREEYSLTYSVLGGGEGEGGGGWQPLFTASISQSVERDARGN